MAKNRVINTKFWSDPYIQGLTPEEKLLYLYLISNSHTEICGVYEITLPTISFESGISVGSVKVHLQKFEADRKIFHLQGLYIYIKNFSKHQQKNPSVDEGVKRSLNLLPPEITAMISHEDSLGTDCTSDPLFNLNSTLTKPNLTLLEPSSDRVSSDGLPPGKKKLKTLDPLVISFVEYCEKRKVEPDIPSEKYLEMRDEYQQKLTWWTEVQKCINWCYDNRKLKLSASRLRNWMDKSLEIHKEKEIKLLQHYQDKKFVPPQKFTPRIEPVWTPPK